jgi:hypothetical protein
MSNIIGLLQELDNYNKSHTGKAWIPSLNAEIDINPLSAGHQKEALKRVMNAVISEYEFNTFLYEILPHVIVDKEINFKNFDVVDKRFLIVALKGMIDEEIDAKIVKKTTEEVVNDEESKKEDEVVTLKISIKEFLESAKKKYQKTVKAKEFKKDLVTFNIQLPTLAVENDSDLLLRKLIRQANFEDDAVRSTVITQIYINTVSTYIKDLTIGETLYDFYQMPIMEKIKVVESLPRTLFVPLSREIDTLAEQVTSFTTTAIGKGKEKTDVVFDLEAMLIS